MYNSLQGGSQFFRMEMESGVKGNRFHVVWQQVFRLLKHGPTGYDFYPSAGYLYTPYSLVTSTIALTFSGFASSKNAPLLMIKPPPLPAVSMSFLQ